MLLGCRVDSREIMINAEAKCVARVERVGSSFE